MVRERGCFSRPLPIYFINNIQYNNGMPPTLKFYTGAALLLQCVIFIPHVPLSSPPPPPLALFSAFLDNVLIVHSAVSLVVNSLPSLYFVTPDFPRRRRKPYNNNIICLILIYLIYKYNYREGNLMAAESYRKQRAANHSRRAGNVVVVVTHINLRSCCFAFYSKSHNTYYTLTL